MQAGITRQDAWQLLRQYNTEPFHLQHALTVEAVMGILARELQQGDEAFWATVGLLHDIDFEGWPEEHCRKAEQIMRGRGVDEVYIRAMLCHGYGPCTDTRPESRMEKTLYAVDELTGLINAACLVRPSHSVLDLEVKSAKKKFKDKAFAAGVNRDVIRNGCEMLGVSLDDLIRETIAGMQERAEEIGLKGSL